LTDILHVRNNEGTKDILIDKSQQAWNLFDLCILENSEPIPHPVQAILDSNGRYTKFSCFLVKFVMFFRSASNHVGTVKA
jgi:hypothetical protein